MEEEKAREQVKRVYGKWTHEDMESALRDYKEGKIRLNACCKKFKIPKKTFLRHFRGEVRRNLARGVNAAVNRRVFIKSSPIETEQELEQEADEEESKDTAIHYSFQNQESPWMINPDAQQLPLEESEPVPQHPSPRRHTIFTPKEMQSTSRKSHRKEEYSTNDELSQRSAKKAAFSMALNSITRMHDDHRVFGDFVASSLRNLKSDKIRRKLRLDIQRAILEASMLDHSEQTDVNT